MAYNIVKHRRGTTQEWLEIDLIPEDGELVVEECADGTRKCKIGNGLYSFTKLPYVDDATRVQLLDELDKLRDEFTDKLDRASTSITEQLKADKLELESSITSTKAILDESILSAANKAAGGVQTALNQKLDTAQKTLQASIKAVDAKVDEKVDLVLKAAETAHTDLSEAITDATAEVKETLSQEIKDVEEVLDNKIDVETSTRTIQFNNLDKRIGNVSAVLEGQIRPTIKQIDEKHTAAIEELAATHTTTVAQLSTELSDKTTDLAKQISDQEVSFNGKLSTAVGSVTKDYTEKVKTLKTDLTQTISDLDSEHKEALAGVKDSLETSIETSATEWASNLATLRQDLVAADDLLLQVIEDFKNSEKLVANNTNSTIETLDKKVEGLVQADIGLKNSISAVETLLERSKTEIYAELDSAKQKHTVDCARIFAEISRIEELQKTSDALITDTTLEALSHVYMELANLVDYDILVINRVYASEIKLRDEMTAMNNQLTSDISQLDAAVDSKIVEIEETIATAIAELKSLFAYDIGTLRTSLLTNIEKLKLEQDIQIKDNADAIKTLAASVADFKKNTETNISAVSRSMANLKIETLAATKAAESKVNSLEEALDSTNTKLAVQADRISRIMTLNPGSTTGDVELLDIRKGYDTTVYLTAGDAVRAVGYELSSLRNSLKQYIDTQAIDGLYYDYTGEVGLMQPYMLYLKAKDEVIAESGVQIISGAGGGGGGNASASSLTIAYVTQSPVITTISDKTVLTFTFSGTDGSGDTIAQANAMWKINGVTKEYGTVKDGTNEFDVTKYLSVGTTKVHLTVTDDNGSVATKTWSVQQIELSVDSSFNDKLTYEANKEIVFTYTPNGAVEKTAVFILNGKEYKRIELSADVSGRDTRTTIAPQKHGSHFLEFYLEATINGAKVTSNHATKDILCYDPSAKTPVIGVQEHNITVKQYSTTPIVYTVYDPTTENPDVTIYVDGREVAKTTVKANIAYGGTPTDVYSYTEAVVGTHIVKIVCGDTVKEITVDVENLGITIEPITDGLAFDFNPAGKSNADTENRLWKDGNVSLSVSDNFDWINGGYIPNDPEGPCFCVKAGSTATINYKLFADEAQKNGKEFKLIFKTSNVANPDAVFLTCVDNTTAKDHIGISMGVHTATIYAKSGSLDLAYSEDDVIEFEFNISANTEKVPMVMGYEDGVPSRPMVYDDSYSFTQNTTKDIVIGSPDCDVYVYRLKVYNTSLSNVDILNNFIADARTAEEMIARYTRNQIYDENNKLTPETLAEKCPWLRVYKISAPKFTNNKSDKVTGTTIQQIYKNGDPILDNWICYDAQHSGQGTSSNNYGAAGRNLDFIMNKSGITGIKPRFVLGDGSDASKITLTRTSVPVAYLNAKVNIASSNNMTNAMLANRYNKFNPYKRPFAERSGINTAHIKDTMEFYNCVIFIQETDPDTSTHREFKDNDWHFYAIGNIGDSKKTDDTRLTDPSDKYECCVELMDVDLALSDFPIDTMINAMGTKKDKETGEISYIWAKDSNLDKLYELNGSFVPTQDTEIIRNKAYYSLVKDDYKCIAYPDKTMLPNLYELQGEYVLTSDTTVDLTKTYYVDVLENDDFSEDFTYGWRYISDDEDDEVVSFCKQKWIEFYRFVTRSSDEEFIRDFDKYFVKDSALYYYLFTTRYCMVDNRAKNTFWHYSKTEDKDDEGNPIRKWDLCWDYDNDTSLGLNNYGKQVYRYGLEDTDKDAAGEEVFRESDSTFFCRVRDLFPGDLQRMFNTLEGKDAWHAESFINAADAWQAEFPEELWRLDIDRKYIRTYTSSFINGAGDSQFLVNMCNGRMKYHRRQWERSQEQYMASKYLTSRASGDNYHANFRFGGPTTTPPAVNADYALTLTPYSYVYLTVAYSNGTSTVRAVPNVPVTVPYNSTFSTDIVNVYCASAIRDFGDLSTCYPKTVSVGNATRVKKLTLGNSTPGYDNNAFTTLTTGANPLLEELNVENISSLTQSLNLKQLTNLKTLKAFGTNAPSVSFAEGGKIEYAEIPAVNEISLKNLKYLSTNNFKLSNYDNVTSLIIDDCPLINQLTVFEKCPNLLEVRLTDIDFGYKTYSYFKQNLFGLTGITATGEKTDNAVLIGKASFAKLTGAQFDELTARYPNLEIKYDQLDSTVTFKDTNLTTTIHEGTATSYNNIVADYLNPVTNGVISSPVKASTAEFDFVFVGWAKETEVIIPEVLPDDSEHTLAELERIYREDSVKKVEGNRVLYPVFKTVRRSYPVRFYNPTAKTGDGLLQTVMTPYGSNSVYTAATPEKLDAAFPALYWFTGWYPKPENITGPLDCYAQFAVLDDKWYTLGINDIAEYLDPWQKPQVGYTINEADKTLYIKGCNNKDNAAIKIPEQIDIYRENVGPNINLTVKLDNEAYETVSFNYKFTSGDTLSFGLYDEAGENYYGTYVLNATDAFEIYEGITVAEDTNGYYKVTLDLATLQLTNDDINRENAPAAIDTLRFFGWGASEDTTAATGFVDHVQVNGPSGEKTFLVNNYTVTGIKCFGQFSDMELISLPKSLRTIDTECFFNCYSLFELELPENLETIGPDAFRGCLKIKKVEIPASVTSLGYAAFGECESLADIKVAEGNPKYYVDESSGLLIDKVNKTALRLKSNVANCTIPSSVDTIGRYCFSKTDLEYVTIPEGIKDISSNAFYSCPRLYGISFPRSLENLEATCFGWCTNLSMVRLPEGLKNIKTYAFYLCPISTINIPSSVDSILDRAFGDNDSLKTVTFAPRGSKLPNIVSTAFFGTGKVNPVTFNVPWSEGEVPGAPWGAENAKINYNYVEGTTNA